MARIRRNRSHHHHHHHQRQLNRGKKKAAAAAWIPLVMVIPFMVAAVHTFQVLTHTHTSKIVRSSGGSSSGVIGTGSVHQDEDDSLKPNNTATTSTSPYAYAFLVAGCNPRKPSYLGYIYNILVSTHILRHHNSTADIVVLLRMATSTSATRLPTKVEVLLKKAGVRMRYIPKVKVDNFYTAMMDKFRILEMVEYRRVLYLDGDVMPLCNLDYMFHLTDDNHKNATTLAPNVILAYKNSPAHGGFFLLSPHPTAYSQIHKIIKRRELQGYNFDTQQGWGHAIQPPDKWRALGGIWGRKWTYYGALADQGLLYYWVKYVKKDVSVVLDGLVERWWGYDEDEEEGPYQDESDTTHPKQQQQQQQQPPPPPPFTKRQTQKTVSKINSQHNLLPGCHPTTTTIKPQDQQTTPTKIPSTPPYSDYIHFTSLTKPWMQKRNSKTNTTHMTDMNQAETSYELWFYVLRKVLKEFEWYNGHGDGGEELEGLNKKPGLGLFPAHSMVQKVLEADLQGEEQQEGKQKDKDQDQDKDKDQDDEEGDDEEGDEDKNDDNDKNADEEEEEEEEEEED